MARLLLLLYVYEVGQSATPGSLDQECLLADALGYDGRQLVGHRRDTLSLSLSLSL
eukprot:COSAG03_NODE_14243_length_471_cov_1.422043_1_plen_55_part_01